MSARLLPFGHRSVVLVGLTELVPVPVVAQNHFCVDAERRDKLRDDERANREADWEEVLARE
jgi:hypothetical protein